MGKSLLNSFQWWGLLCFVPGLVKQILSSAGYPELAEAISGLLVNILNGTGVCAQTVGLLNPNRAPITKIV